MHNEYGARDRAIAHGSQARACMMHTWRKSLESSPKLPSLYAEVEMIEKKRQTNAAHADAGVGAPLLRAEIKRMNSLSALYRVAARRST